VIIFHWNQSIITCNGFRIAETHYKAAVIQWFNAAVVSVLYRRVKLTTVHTWRWPPTSVLSPGSRRPWQVFHSASSLQLTMAVVVYRLCYRTNSFWFQVIKYSEGVPRKWQTWVQSTFCELVIVWWDFYHFLLHAVSIGNQLMYCCHRPFRGL
jgi:hypothetical protein